MLSPDKLRAAKRTAEELRQRGEVEGAQAIEALIQAAEGDTLPALDLLTSTQTGDLFGVSGQTIKNWVRQGKLSGYRVGARIMVPKTAVEEYVRRAGQSLDLEEVSDEEAARLVEEGRRHR